MVMPVVFMACYYVVSTDAALYFQSLQFPPNYLRASQMSFNYD